MLSAFIKASDARSQHDAPRAKGAKAFLFLIISGALDQRSGMNSVARSKHDSTGELISRDPAV